MSAIRNEADILVVEEFQKIRGGVKKSRYVQLAGAPILTRALFFLPEMKTFGGPILALFARVGGEADHTVSENLEYLAKA